MIQISPQLRIWSRIKALCIELDYPVYDVLPDASAEYPFIHIGEQFDQDNRIHKDYINGQTQVTIHVWHNTPDKRGDLARIMEEVEQAVRMEYMYSVQSVNYQVLIDNTTESNLLHGVVEVDIKY